MKQEFRKYRNKVIVNAFGKFDSIKEWKRYIYLLDQQKRLKIKNLRRQVRYEIIPKQVDKQGKVIERACHYVADFVYEREGKTIVEDVKSAITSPIATFSIKRKLMLYVHGIRINEV